MKKVNLLGLMALLSLQFGALAQTITTSVAPTTSVVDANPLMELKQLTPSIYQRIPIYDPSIEFYPSVPPSFKSDLSFIRGSSQFYGYYSSPTTIHRWDLNSGSNFTFSYRSGTNSFVTPLTINSTGTRLRGELALTNLSNAITFRVTPLGDMTANSATIRAALTAGSATINGNANVGGTLTASSATVNGNALINNLTASSARVNGNTIIAGELFVLGTDLLNQFKVDRTGLVRARRVQVDLATIPDYVFKPDYKLMPLDDLKTFIAKNNHLPNVPSEQEYKERGNIDLSELNLKLLEKVEELTLYVLQLKAEIDLLKKSK